MQTEDIRTLIDLGVLNPRTDDQLNAMQVHGRVMHDPVVWKRTLAIPRDPQYPAMIPMGTWRKVIAAMTPAEKEALRDRILANGTNRNSVQ